MTESLQQSLIRKRFEDWFNNPRKVADKALFQNIAWDAWQAAWIASNDFTLSIVNGGKPSEYIIANAYKLGMIKKSE